MPPRVDDQRRADPRNRAQDRENAAEGQTLAQAQPVGLRVDRLELVVDALFLAKVLGDADAGDRFLHVRIDLGQHAPRLRGRMACDAAESQGNEDHDRRDRQRDQRQPQVDKEQQPHHDRHDQHLAHQIQGQRHDVRKVLRIRCHPADDLAR